MSSGFVFVNDPLSAIRSIIGTALWYASEAFEWSPLSIAASTFFIDVRTNDRKEAL